MGRPNRDYQWHSDSKLRILRFGDFWSKSPQEGSEKSPDLLHATSRDFFRDFAVRENPQNLRNSQISPQNRSKSGFFGQKSSFLKNRDFDQ